MKKIILTLTAAMFALFAANAQTATTAQNQENPNAPVITFENTVHDYGTIQKGGDGNYEFKFTNTGKEPLILTNVTTS